ncbi:MAG TPA: hypothetical protein VGG28_00160 [Kofleriaceae bacterium]|jgi:hypothetical protein
MTRSSLLVLVVLVTGQARTAHADPARDPDLATDLSIASTAGSIALAGAGIAVWNTNAAVGASLVVGGIASLVVTPAIGHVYGEHRFFTGGTMLRAAGLVMLVVGVGDTVSELFCDECSSTPLVLAGAGALAIVGGAVIDLATAHSAAARWNREHGVQIVPMAIPTPSCSIVPGIGVAARF